MDISCIVLMFLIGFIGSFLSGMLGIGGAIIHYPMMLYIPPLLGIASFSAHEVTGMVAVQVFFTTMTGMLVYRKGGYLHKSLALYMGIGILGGSFIGAYGSKWMSEAMIHLIYAFLAAAAVWLMFLSEKESDETPVSQVTFHPMPVMGTAFMAGIFSGVIGASGSFILVPVMLAVFKIPTRVTIATSLAIAFISSIGSVSAKFASDQIFLLPSIILVISSLIASPIGAMISKKTSPQTLRIGLSIVITITFIKIWYDYLALY